MYINSLFRLILSPGQPQSQKSKFIIWTKRMFETFYPKNCKFFEAYFTNNYDDKKEFVQQIAYNHLFFYNFRTQKYIITNIRNSRSWRI